MEEQKITARQELDRHFPWSRGMTIAELRALVVELRTPISTPYGSMDKAPNTARAIERLLDTEADARDQ